MKRRREYWRNKDYERKQEEIRKLKEWLVDEEHYTSTGEEWEIDSDGIEYYPDWLQN